MPKQLELDLEQRVKTVFDWKEWIPLYGVYQAIRNKEKGIPTIGSNSKDPLPWTLFFAHHLNAYVWTATGLAIGAHEAYYHIKDCFSYFS